MRNVMKYSLVVVLFSVLTFGCGEQEDMLKLEESVILQDDLQMTNPSDNDKGGLKGDDD